MLIGSIDSLKKAKSGEPPCDMASVPDSCGYPVAMAE